MMQYYHFELDFNAPESIVIYRQNMEAVPSAFQRGLYEYMGELDITNPEQGFILMNDPDVKRPLPNAPSMSKCDVLIDRANNIAYFCASIGFIKIPIPAGVN